MAVARASASQLIARLTRRKEHTNACALVSILIGCWGVASILAVGVGCHPSRPWDISDRCSNLVSSIALVHVTLLTGLDRLLGWN